MSYSLLTSSNIIKSRLIAKEKIFSFIKTNMTTKMFLLKKIPSYLQELTFPLFKTSSCSIPWAYVNTLFLMYMNSAFQLSKMFRSGFWCTLYTKCDSSYNFLENEQTTDPPRGAPYGDDPRESWEEQSLCCPNSWHLSSLRWGSSPVESPAPELPDERSAPGLHGLPLVSIMTFGRNTALFHWEKDKRLWDRMAMNTKTKASFFSFCLKPPSRIWNQGGPRTQHTP